MNPHVQGNLIWVSDFFDILQNGALEVFYCEKWTKVGQRPPPVFGGGRIIDVVLELPENTHRHIHPGLETLQDFLVKLDMKPRMHLVEISILSLNNVTIRHTKIMSRAN